jgi:hypothetical protein
VAGVAPYTEANSSTTSGTHAVHAIARLGDPPRSHQQRERGRERGLRAVLAPVRELGLEHERQREQHEAGQER